jgi:hypothetical protein
MIIFSYVRIFKETLELSEDTVLDQHLGDRQDTFPKGLGHPENFLIKLRFSCLRLFLLISLEYLGQKIICLITISIVVINILYISYFSSLLIF